MSKTTIPSGYRMPLSNNELQRAIELIHQEFQHSLCVRLNLHRVSAPLFVDGRTGLNDDLNGVERPVSFDIPDVGLDASQGEKQVVSGITPEDPILQHRVLLHGLPQALERERRGRAQALRRIQLVFRHIVIASYLPQRRRVVPYRYYMQPGRLL